MTVHGCQVAGELRMPAGELHDFSANVNPRGLPPGARGARTPACSVGTLVDTLPYGGRASRGVATRHAAVRAPQRLLRIYICVIPNWVHR
jgi:hypothetical protein